MKNALAKNSKGILNAGGLGGIRTRDQRIKSPLLYRLSYQPVKEYNYGLFRLLCQYYCVKYFSEPVIFLPQIDLFIRFEDVWQYYFRL